MKPIIIAAATLVMTAGAAAAACSAGKAPAELSHAEAQALYECLEADMHAGYVSGGKGWIDPAAVEGYRAWRPAATAPAAPGAHGRRFLVTWVNETGYDAYTEFRNDGARMPEGTLIAKESFDVAADGAARPGPLFFMEKAAAGASPQTDDWYYYMVSPSGAPQAVPVVQACHACHSEFFGSDSLGYPAEAVRVSR